MSGFFKRDLSQYPQPVLVRPETAESVPDNVASVAPSDAADNNAFTKTDNALPSIQRSSSTSSNLVSVSTGGGGSKSGDNRDDSTTRGSSNTLNESQQGHEQNASGSGAAVTDQELQDERDQQSQASLADGIMSLLGPVIQEMDFNIVSVRNSQLELEKEIERLMAELQLFMASAAAPPEIEPSIRKLVTARRQIMNANSTLKTVQDRVDRMYTIALKQRK